MATQRKSPIGSKQASQPYVCIAYLSNDFLAVSKLRYLILVAKLSGQEPSNINVRVTFKAVMAGMA